MTRGCPLLYVPSVARALRGSPEGALKSRSSQVYGVTNMFSAELERAPHKQNLVSRRFHGRTEGDCAGSMELSDLLDSDTQCSRQRTGSQYKCVQNVLPARAAFFANEEIIPSSFRVISTRTLAEISGTHIHQTLCFTYNNSEARSKKYHGTMTVY